MATEQLKTAIEMRSKIGKALEAGAIEGPKIEAYTLRLNTLDELIKELNPAPAPQIPHTNGHSHTEIPAIKVTQIQTLEVSIFFRKSEDTSIPEETSLPIEGRKVVPDERYKAEDDAVGTLSGGFGIGIEFDSQGRRIVAGKWRSLTFDNDENLEDEYHGVRSSRQAPGAETSRQIARRLQIQQMNLTDPPKDPKKKKGT